jgi:hypothetical protein
MDPPISGCPQHDRDSTAHAVRVGRSSNVTSCVKITETQGRWTTSPRVWPLAVAHPPIRIWAVMASTIASRPRSRFWARRVSSRSRASPDISGEATLTGAAAGARPTPAGCGVQPGAKSLRAAGPGGRPHGGTLTVCRRAHRRPVVRDRTGRAGLPGLDPDAD